MKKEAMRTREIYLAAGCFWGVQKYFDCVTGVLSTEVGYANGNTEEPTYAEVCAGTAGHAEVVRVRYDADVIGLSDIMNLFFRIIDPVSVNRQGYDVGLQYRTGVYYADPADLPVIERAVAEEQNKHGEPIATEVQALHNYCSAETYHQKYLEKNPKGYCHVGKIEFGYARNYTPEKSA